MIPGALDAFAAARVRIERPAVVLCGLDAWARQGGPLREQRERLAGKYLLALGAERRRVEAEATRLLRARRRA